MKLTIEIGKDKLTSRLDKLIEKAKFGLSKDEIKEAEILAQAEEALKKLK